MQAVTLTNPYVSPADLSPAAGQASMVEAILEPGERLVWSGRPRLRAFLASTSGGCLVGMAIWAAIALSNSSSQSGGTLVLIGLASWLCLPAWVLPWAWWVSRHTHYFITDRRAIGFAFRWGGYRIVVNAAEDIGFARYVGSFFGWWGAISWSEPTAWAQVHSMFSKAHGSFFAIPHARTVFRLMHATFASRLAERLSDSDPEVRRKAAFGLTRVESLPDAVTGDIVPSLIAALECDDSVVRARVATALGRLGNAGREAVPALKRVALTDESQRVVINARKAIERLRAYE